MATSWVTKEQRARAAKRPGVAANATWIDCIVPGCEMTLNVTPPVIDTAKAMGVAAAMGAPLDHFPKQAALQHAQRVERACESHLSSHTPQEWAPALSTAQRHIREQEETITAQADEIRWLRQIARNHGIDLEKERI